MAKNSLEYQLHKQMHHWQPVKNVYADKELLDQQNKYFPLFSHIYSKVKELYMHLPPRKNGEYPFIHPINVVVNLKRAGVTDGLTISAGVMHDYIEEKVDLYKKINKIKEDKKGIKLLDDFEHKVTEELREELEKFCKTHNFSKQDCTDLIGITLLLTRHKRDFYYASIAGIFSRSTNGVKERAIQVKLADRTHNILCIEAFNEQERIYQCFKNLFILNSTKKYLLDNYGKNVLGHKKHNPTERLFNKCCKATYDAFLTCLRLCSEKNIESVRAPLQLAFKKFAFETKGLWEVTKPAKLIHPMRLYYGVVRKYDARLHHEWEKFEAINKNEKIYLMKFFKDHKFSKSQIQAIIDYKDAYALKEVVARFLYIPDYVIEGFLVSQLSEKGRMPR